MYGSEDEAGDSQPEDQLTAEAGADEPAALTVDRPPADEVSADDPLATDPRPATDGTNDEDQPSGGGQDDDAVPASASADTEASAGSTLASQSPPSPPAGVQQTVSQEIARLLHAAGARYCFTVPAEPILQLLDDLAATGIRVVTTRHEGSAAFMAEALAQSTGRPQVVAVSRAVGAANAAIGIHTAQQDSAPLVALVGQVQTSFLGREAFQESDLATGIGALATWAAQVDSVDQAGPILENAWRRLTTGRPGPILLSVPVDVQSHVLELPDAEVPKAPGARGVAADRAAVRRAMKMLAASERGVIVAGGGVLQARATKRLVALSEALAVPVIASWRRPDVFPNDHVNYLGMSGPWAAATVPPRLADADVILFIGTRLSETTTAGYRIPGPGTRWIHVDVEPRVAGVGLSAPTLAISADASRFLDSAWSDIRAAALDNEMRERRVARNAADRETFKAASEVGQGVWSGPGAHPGKIVTVLRNLLPDNATISTDAGNLAAFVARGFRFRRAGTFTGATSGAMGFGLPSAIAASLADPDRISVAVCGDGGFAMSLAELETAVREGAHPVVIVLDNQRYGTIAASLTRDGGGTSITDLGAIDFASAARAHGALGFTVTGDSAFEPALREAITSRQTSVVHVIVDRSWRSVDDNPVAASAVGAVAS